MALFKKKAKDAKAGEEGEEQDAPGAEEKPAAPPPLEAAEGAPPGEGAGEGGGKKSKKKLIIIVVAALVVIGGAVGGMFAMGMIGGEHKADEEASVHEEAVKETGRPVYYTLPEFLVNLNTASVGKQTSFLKTTIVLQLEKMEDVKTVEANLPRLLDNMNTYLREMRPSDISGSAGMYRLREELTLRVSKTLAPVKVTDVLFKEIIVQ